MTDKSNKKQSRPETFFADNSLLRRVTLLDEVTLLHEGIQQLNVGVSIYDANLNLVARNARFLKMFDLPEEMVRVGMPLAPIMRLLAERGEFGPGDSDELAHNVLESLRTLKEPATYERRRANGFCYEAHTARLKSGGYITIHTDITHRKQREEKLEVRVRERTAELLNSKIRLDGILAEMVLILRNASLGICTIVPAADGGRILRRVNLALARILGYEPGEIEGQDTRFMYPSDEEYVTVSSGYNKIVSAGQTYHGEHVLQRKDGTTVLCAMSGSAIDPDDLPKGSVWLFEDITEKKRMEAELARKSELLQAAIDHMPGGMVVFDKDLRYALYTKGVDSFFSMPPGMLKVGLAYEDVLRYFAGRGDFGSGDIDTLVEEAIRPVRERKTLHVERHLPDSTVLDVRRKPLPSGGVVSIFQDITEQKRLEAEVAAKSELLQASIDHMPGGMVVFDKDLRYVLWTKGIESFFDLPPGMLKAGLPFETVLRYFAERGDFGPGDIDTLIEDQIRPVREREILFEERLIPGGMIIEVRRKPLPSGGVVNIYQNITERKRMEAEILHAKAAAERDAYAIRLKSDQVANLLNNSNQGFFSFSGKLIIDPEYSRACVSMLGMVPAGLDVADVLFANDPKKADLLRITVPSALAEKDPWKRETMLSLLPSEFPHNNKYLEAEYKILENQHVMTVLTDITEEKQLKERVERERRRLEMIVAAVTDNRDFFDTVEDFRAFFTTELASMVQAPVAVGFILREVYRQVHTFKGLLNQFSFQKTPEALHELENQLEEMRQLGHALSIKAITDAVLSVSYEALLEADLAVLREVLGDDFVDKGDRVVLTAAQAERLEELASHLLRGDPVDTTGAEIRRLLQEIGCLRKMPIKDALVHYDRLVKQIAERLDKEVTPVVVNGGGDIWIDPDIYRPFLRSLVHVFRNAMVHGIEDPDSRIYADKHEAGTITCSVYKEGSLMKLSIADDGAGVNLRALRRKAVEMGFYRDDEVADVPEERILDLIFRDNFSTQMEVSTFTGRGVGLAAVLKETQALGGNVSVRTAPGKGTEFLFTLPLQ